MLAQVFDQVGTEVPDLDDPSRMPLLFDALAGLRRAGLVLAYHDRSDGGLFVTLAEMAFAGHVGLDHRRGTPAGRLVDASAPASWLFNEELGVVVQVRVADRARVR